MSTTDWPHVMGDLRTRMKQLVEGSRLELPVRKLWARLNPQMNAIYDLQTLEVMHRVLRPDSNAVDVGCHRGQILSSILRLAPQGKHNAFEPLPDMYKALCRRFAGRHDVRLYDCALGDERGVVAFQHVVSNPAYSGLLRRRYDRPDEVVVQIEVATRRLDDLIRADERIDFMKVDVEGAELQVFLGASKTLARCRPVIVFEHGLGGADCYGTTPMAVHSLLSAQCGLDLYLMDEWLLDARRRPLGEADFCDHFASGRHYYFMAAPRMALP
jgi:FkbM family methyltransferase